VLLSLCTCVCMCVHVCACVYVCVLQGSSSVQHRCKHIVEAGISAAKLLLIEMYGLQGRRSGGPSCCLAAPDRDIEILRY